MTVTRPHCPGCPVPSPPVFSQRHSVYKPPPSHAFPLIVLLQCITSCSTPGFLPLKIFLVIVLCQLESSSSSLLYGCMLFHCTKGPQIIFFNFFLIAVQVQLLQILFFKDFYLFIFRVGKGREKARERNINVWWPLMYPLLGT